MQETDLDVTVYTRDGCQKCKATIRQFRARGVEPDIIDTEEPYAVAYGDYVRPDIVTPGDYLIDQGFTSLPVVEVDGETWQDHQPTRIEALFK